MIRYGNKWICLHEMRRLRISDTFPTHVARSLITVTWLCIVHMTLTFSSLILIRAARSSVQSVSRPILSSTTPSKLAITRKMSDASKTKSEEEWQAVLTPEQVRLSQCPSHSGTPPYRERTHSSGCFVRRAPSVLARGSTSIIKRPGSTPARVATRRFTRATPSSTAAAVGQRFSMVMKIPFAMCDLAMLTVSSCQPSQALYRAT